MGGFVGGMEMFPFNFATGYVNIYFRYVWYKMSRFSDARCSVFRRVYCVKGAVRTEQWLTLTETHDKTQLVG